jgi:Mn-dependent DtxR family transcriptional regulator
MDRTSAIGPWTRSTLDLIAERPETRAGDLAEQLGQERLPFKANVRKLKALGLTESLEVGYRLSPRGRAYLARTPV